MKVSSIKTILPVAAAGLMALATSCSTATERAEKYMEETNRTQAELNAIKSGNVQSKLDSIAYRDIFMGTEAAKDSANLAEFNKIAARLRVPDDMYFSETSKYLDDKLAEEGISIKDMNGIKSKETFWDWDLVKVNRKQHYADDWAYREFFEKIGIMDEDLAKKCDSISEKIAP